MGADIAKGSDINSLSRSLPVALPYFLSSLTHMTSPGIDPTAQNGVISDSC